MKKQIKPNLTFSDFNKFTNHTSLKDHKIPKINKRSIWICRGTYTDDGDKDEGGEEIFFVFYIDGEKKNTWYRRNTQKKFQIINYVILVIVM